MCTDRPGVSIGEAYEWEGHDYTEEDPRDELDYDGHDYTKESPEEPLYHPEDDSDDHPEDFQADPDEEGLQDCTQPADAEEGTTEA